MLIFEYKLDTSAVQEAAIEEAIRVTQFIRNKALRLWMDTRGTNRNDLHCLCATLARDFPFVRRLNSQARQAAASRAWFAIERFYANCKNHKPGKKGYPRFQHDNRSVEYKQTGWKLEPDGKHLTFTDGCGIGRVRLVGNKKQRIEEYPTKQIKRVRIVRRADGSYVQFGVAAERSIEHRQREDFARKTASALISSHDLIAYEDLQIRNMVRNHRLAKSISDAAWGQFLTWVKYFGAMQGIAVIAVEPAWTSQVCSGCGKIVKKSLSVRTHVCPFCGLVLDRDHNAAKNVLDKALQGTGGQSGTSSSSPEDEGNAWGEASATAVFARMPEHDASLNQEPPRL